MAELWNIYLLPGLEIVGYVLLIVVPLLGAVAYLTLAERKVIAAMLRTGAEGDFRSNIHRGGTAKMIAEAAVCLARDPLDGPGGILTPAVAMGPELITRLIKNAGLTFEVID
jgi:NADH:ubiquinone oxidoreductase subunit H